jgi:aconitase A
MLSNPFQIKKTLITGNGSFTYYSLPELEKQGYGISKMPFSIRVLLENAVRNFDGFAVTKENIETILQWKPAGSDRDIPFKPARVLMQDFLITTFLYHLIILANGPGTSYLLRKYPAYSAAPQPMKMQEK